MAESTWEVTEPRKLTFDEPVSALTVRVVGGAVNVVGAGEGPARLEVSRIDGPALTVTQKGSALTVAYRDLPWKSWLKWLDRSGRARGATVSLIVPADAAVEIGVVGAETVVSGMRGPVTVHTVGGDATLVRLSGDVRAETVTGNLLAQSLTGSLRYQSVSGNLTVIDGGTGAPVRAEAVSGDMLIDLAAPGDGGDGDDSSPRAADVKLASVSGDLAVRLPHPADAEVEAHTASGSVSNAFEDLRVAGEWGAKKITGRLGAGRGALRATTVSGSIALLRRPPDQDETDPPGGRATAPPEAPAGAEPPAAGAPGDGAADSSESRGGADSTGKVL